MGRAMARSSVLLDLLHAGAVSSDGKLWRAGEIRQDKPAIAIYLGYVVRSVSSSRCVR